MRKQRVRQQRLRDAGWRRPRARVVIATALCVSLFAAWMLLASSGALDSAFRQKGKKGGTVSLASLNSNSPAKEYIYAGGRLIAQSSPGAGLETIGLYDPIASNFFLRNSNSTGVADLFFGYGAAGGGWIPITGDWDGL